jgi:outer membrane lipoprotein-sorting protein
VGKYWSASEITMFDLKKGSKTQIQMIQPKYDQGLSDDEFTIRKLIN